MSNGQSFSFNDIDFGAASYNLYVINHPLPHLPTPRVEIVDLSGADGAVTQGATFEPQYLDLVCAVSATSEANRKTQILNIRTALITSQEGEKNMSLDQWPDRGTFSARLLSGINATPAILGETFTLKFIIPNPEVS